MHFHYQTYSFGICRNGAKDYSSDRHRKGHDCQFSRESFAKASECLLKEMKLPKNVPRGQAAFHMMLATSFLCKFWLLVAREHQQDIDTIKDNTSPDFPAIAFPLPSTPFVNEFKKSGTESFISTPKPSITGVQTYPAPIVASGIERINFCQTQMQLRK